VTEPVTAPWALGRLLAQLSCAGVPARAADLPAPVTDALGTELAARLCALEFEDIRLCSARQATNAPSIAKMVRSARRPASSSRTPRSLRRRVRSRRQTAKN
jgi:hypothetical protein